MARVKQAIVQRDFSLGELREDFLERGDTEFRGRGLRLARNIRILDTGAIEARHGTVRVLTQDYKQIFEVTIRGVPHLMLITAAGYLLRNEAGATVSSNVSINWTDPMKVWVAPTLENVVIGHPEDGLFLLRQVPSDGSWRLADFAFEEAPFWAHERGTTIQPSARTGSVTVVCSSDVFTAQHVGSVIRYGGQKLTITGFTSPTQVTCTVNQTLPPSFRVTFNSTDVFNVGDQVIGEDSGFIGVITALTSTTIDVLTTENFDGPSNTEGVSSPRGTRAVQSLASISPVASTVWDEQLFSEARGWPSSGVMASGRLTLIGGAAAPSVIAMSSLRSLNDFQAGADDDDAIVRSVGDNAPFFRHATVATDLLFFSDKGVFIQNLRDNVLTPSSFAPVVVDTRGCNRVRPVAVSGGAVFVGSDNSTILAALLDGNIYVKWSVRPVSNLSRQQDKTCIGLCAPAQFASTPEQYVLCINSDGTVGAAKWDVSEGSVSFVLWETDGQWTGAASVFGAYYFLATRNINGTSTRFLERMEPGVYTDCAATVTINAAGQASHLAGETVALVQGDRYLGEAVVSAAGAVSIPYATGTAEAGLNFVAEAQLWPVEVINSPYAGMIRVRCTRLGVSLQGTGHVSVRCNAITREVGGYRFGDNLSGVPDLIGRRTWTLVTGRPAHQDLAVLRMKPGPWRVLATAQEVTANG